MTNDLAKYRNAILWAVDYFGTSRLTERERTEGVKQLGKVLLGQPSRAADYAPNEWDDSSALSPAERQKSTTQTTHHQQEK